MNQHIAHIALVVTNYDKAIKFYTEKLHLYLHHFTKQYKISVYIILYSQVNIRNVVSL